MLAGHKNSIDQPIDPLCNVLCSGCVHADGQACAHLTLTYLTLLPQVRFADVNVATSRSPLDDEAICADPSTLISPGVLNASNLA